MADQTQLTPSGIPTMSFDKKADELETLLTERAKTIKKLPVNDIYYTCYTFTMELNKSEQKVKEYHKNWQENNRDKVRAYNKKWHAANKAKVWEYKKEWRKTHKEMWQERQRKYYFRHKEIILQKRRDYYHAQKATQQEKGGNQPQGGQH